MKKVIVIAVVMLLIVPLLSVPVYAAAGDDIGIGEFLLQGLKTLFVPRDDYFPRLQTRLFEAFQSKFGGILSVADYLRDRLGNLRAYRGDLFVLKFPESHLFGGANIDILAGSEGISSLIRGGLSGFVMLCTVAFGYKKVVAMINS